MKWVLGCGVLVLLLLVPSTQVGWAQSTDGGGQLDASSGSAMPSDGDAVGESPPDTTPQNAGCAQTEKDSSYSIYMWLGCGLAVLLGTLAILVQLAPFSGRGLWRAVGGHLLPLGIGLILSGVVPTQLILPAGEAYGFLGLGCAREGALQHAGHPLWFLLVFLTIYVLVFFLLRKRINN